MQSLGLAFCEPESHLGEFLATKQRENAFARSSRRNKHGVL